MSGSESADSKIQDPTPNLPLTKSGKIVEVGTIDLVKAEPFSEIGEDRRARLVMLDPKQNPIPDVQIRAWMQDNGGARTELNVVADATGHTVNYKAPAKPGTFRILFDIAGLGLYEEYFVSLSKTVP